jgi:hypothetical protein
MGHCRSASPVDLTDSNFVRPLNQPVFERFPVQRGI